MKTRRLKINVITTRSEPKKVVNIHKNLGLFECCYLAKEINSTQHKLFQFDQFQHLQEPLSCHAETKKNSSK